MTDFDLFDDYDDYDVRPTATLEEDRPDRPRRGGGCSNLVYNVLTMAFIAASIGLIAVVVLLVRDPNTPLNPFSPQAAQQPTVEPTNVVTEDIAPAASPTVDPTRQATPTTDPAAAQPVATVTPVVLPTAAPSATPVTPQVTATGASAPIGSVNSTPSQYPFVLENGEVTARAYTGAERCEFLGVAGQVFNQNGEPVVGIPVVVEGDEFFENLVLTGSAPRYGQSGYEVRLNDAPIEATFTVQLWSDTGFQISEPVAIETTESCEENLIIVNFVATQPLD